RAVQAGSLLSACAFGREVVRGSGRGGVAIAQRVVPHEPAGGAQRHGREREAGAVARPPEQTRGGDSRSDEARQRYTERRDVKCYPVTLPCGARRPRVRVLPQLTPAVIFDTNVCRELTGARLSTVVELERRRGIAQYADLWVMV